jgi:exopolysaccharide production protein ExoZ
LIRSIQYLRGIAALMVVWHHALSQITGTIIFIRLPEFGPSGVDIFFVISGFIMVVTTHARPITGRQFMGLRIVRVVPLYWLATLAMIAAAIATPAAFKSLRFDAISIVKSLLFIPYDSLAFPGNVWPVLIPGWTLNFEMFFYVIFALSLCLPKWRLQAVMLVLCTLVMVGSVVSPRGPAAWVYTNPMLLEFGAGVVIAHEWLSGRLRRGPWVSLAMMAIGFFLLVLGSRLELLTGASLIVMGALNPGIGALENRPLLELGNASYSIYLTHLFTLGLLRVLWVWFVPRTSMASSIAFMTVAILGAAVAGWICFRLIERPMTRRLHQMLNYRHRSLGNRAIIKSVPSTV